MLVYIVTIISPYLTLSIQVILAVKIHLFTLFIYFGTLVLINATNKMTRKQNITLERKGVNI